MTRKHFFTSISVLALCAVALPAHAQDSGLYANVGITLVSIDTQATTISDQGVSATLSEQSIDALAFTGRVGYRIFDYLAIEGEAGFGLSGDSVNESVPVTANTPLGTFSANADTTIDADIDDYFGVFARGILPVSDQFELHARLGYGTASASLDATATIPNLGSASASESDSIDGIAYGIGGQYNFSGQHGIRFDFAAIDGDTTANILTGTYVFNF